MHHDKIKLSDLEPELITYAENGSLSEVASLAEAQGILYLCPLCYAKNGGAIGTHRVNTTFDARGVPDHLGSHSEEGAPTRWVIASGSGFHDLTLTPSIWLKGSVCGWHGFITFGLAN